MTSYGRLGFSPLIGQMVAGIILGPMVLRVKSVSRSDKHDIPCDFDLEMLTDVGILFMMFLMGLSIGPGKGVWREMVYKATLVSIARRYGDLRRLLALIYRAAGIFP